MIVFDVDGTLIGGESTDWACFGAAFEEAAGFTLDDSFFAGLEEITAQAIVHQALPALPPELRKQKEHAVREGYLKRLQLAHETHPDSFPATEGALALLLDLQAQGIPVAIATGDWRESISFKLRAAGIPFESIPMVTSSEYYSRADIIAGAVSLAGRFMGETIYIGDGLWDFRACQKLGIPFIGVGHRRDRLLQAGARHTLADLSPAAFWRVRNEMKWPVALT